ncbi:MAG: hypothetical protein ACLPTF_10125 [Steroidobacteraceae bacterium]
MSEQFQFSDARRRTIIKAFPDCVPESERADYIVRAEAFIRDLKPFTFIEDGKAANQKLHKALAKLQRAADAVTKIYDEQEPKNVGVPFMYTLHKGQPPYLLAAGLKQDLAKLTEWDPSFGRAQSRNRPPQTMQTMLASNLLGAYRLATGHGNGDWKVIVATGVAYRRDRKPPMPDLEPFTDNAHRRALALFNEINPHIRPEK